MKIPLLITFAATCLFGCVHKEKKAPQTPAATTDLVDSALVEADKALLDAEDAAAKTGSNLEQAKAIAKEIEARSARLMR